MVISLVSLNGRGYGDLTRDAKKEREREREREKEKTERESRE